ncbi:MAG: hypothetical protein ACI9TY_000868 [Alphaproteobacteria bacterium]|jgi:hypothetical protein
MKTSIFATILVAIFALGSMTVSAPVEGSKLSDWFKGDCVQSTSKARQQCRKQRADRYEREINKEAKQLNKVISSYNKEYSRFQAIKSKQQSYIDEALRLENRKAELTIAQSIGELSRNDSRELGKVDRYISKAYSNADRQETYKARSYNKLKEYERVYTNLTGRPGSELKYHAEDNMSDMDSY